MATSKLLKPTNVTISIPEFTDQPDQRVNSNCLDKEADAINSLSEHLGTVTGDDLQTQVNKKANVLKSNLAGGSSVSLTITRPAFVSVGRASTSTASTTALIEPWGIVYLSNNAQNFGVSIDSNTLTISNYSGGYCGYIVIF